MQKFYTNLILGVLMSATIPVLVAWVQKVEKTTEEAGVTLADFGVTAEQTAEVKSLWKLKRQRQIQAIENLRPLN